MSYSAPLVGAYFRPPAQAVLSQLPSGAALLIEREPLNPYDHKACRVLLPGFSETGAYKQLYLDLMEAALPDGIERNHKGEWYQSDLTDPLHLGYIGSKTGHAEAVCAVMQERSVTSLPASLAFNPSGQAEVTFE